MSERHTYQPSMDAHHAAALAADPEIESLPFVGRTWYRRGPLYLFRRMLMSALFLGLTAFWVVVLWSILLGVNAKQGRTAAEVFLIVIIAVSIPTGWLFAGTLPSGQYKKPNYRFVLGTAGTGAAAGALARVGGIVGGFFLLFGLIFTVGPLLVMSIRTFTPVLYAEREARTNLEFWYQQRGRPVPWQGARAPWDGGMAPLPGGQ